MAAGDVDVRITTADARQCAVIDNLANSLNCMPFSDHLDDAFTLACWIYPVNTDEAHRLIEKGNNEDWKITYVSNVLTFIGGEGTGNSVSITPVVNTWQHVAVTFDGTTMVPYLNGIAGTSATHSIFTKLSTQVRIGNYGAAGNYGFGGAVADAQIYSRALTAAEIVYLFQGRCIADSSLEARYKFKGDYTDSIKSNNLTNTGCTIKTIESGIATAVKAQRAIASGAFMIFSISANQVGTAGITEI